VGRAKKELRHPTEQLSTSALFHVHQVKKLEELTSELQREESQKERSVCVLGVGYRVSDEWWWCGVWRGVVVWCGLVC